MAKYTNSASTFDVGNLGFSAGDGFVRCGPETNCEYVCSDIPEDGLVTVSGCGGLLDCEIEINEIPCIEDKKACDPCNTCSSSGDTGGGDTGTGETITLEQVTEIATNVAQECIDKTVADAAALKP